jgi:hydroxyacylglutathione hydrolase
MGFKDINKIANMDILPIKAFTDNYIWAIVFHKTKQVIIVDPGDATVALKNIEQMGLQLIAIFITHHHFDHTGGVSQLCKIFPDVKVYGPKLAKIPEITHSLADNDSFEINSCVFIVKETPGHTLDHIVFYTQNMLQYPVLFCGDTFFSCGCGRLFEGTATEMVASLEKILTLPEETRIYPAHEYTLANIKFSMLVEPQNRLLQQYFVKTVACKDKNLPTLPVTLANELEVNPFLRCLNNKLDLSAIPTYLNLSNKTTVFSFIRKWKDNF